MLKIIFIDDSNSRELIKAVEPPSDFRKISHLDIYYKVHGPNYNSTKIYKNSVRRTRIILIFEDFRLYLNKIK